MMSPELWDALATWTYSMIVLAYGGPLFAILGLPLALWSTAGGARRHPMLFSLLALPVLLLGLCVGLAGALLLSPSLFH